MDEAKKLRDNYASAVQRWNVERLAFYDNAEADKARIEALKSDVLAGDSYAIETAAKTAIWNSDFQDETSNASYDEESKILLIDYTLPNFDYVRIIEDCNFSARGKAKVISAKALGELRDEALYAFVLGAAFDFGVMFEEAPVEAIAVNGWLTKVDPATGNVRSDVVMSLFAKKEMILDLNIKQCDPKTAFKSLKGLTGARPHEYLPVQPIYVLDTEDDRIVEGRVVLDATSDSENLGAMHWDDFEHLIREVFELEFAQSGAEVKVTRASKDSGVDAIVFDPDPIRGGKIVLQAKRYVNTVDVSAVRDLYGTIQNEGANKGILITTSGFGSDSYEFAKGKPMTLMNGQNLLWLLAKHGRKFEIDLPAARKILKERGWL